LRRVCALKIPKGKADRADLEARLPGIFDYKVCPGTRSATGSKNVAIFASVVETAKLRGCETLEVFEALLTEPPETPR
jgi:hypothetical protein